MEMRKVIVEIHLDGRVTCCEYEDPRDSRKSAGLPDSVRPSPIATENTTATD